jgi:hypothetical protein
MLGRYEDVRSTIYKKPHEREKLMQAGVLGLLRTQRRAILESRVRSQTSLWPG